MNIFLTVLSIVLIVFDFFILSNQKKKIEELTKENDRLKNFINKKVSV